MFSRQSGGCPSNAAARAAATAISEAAKPGWRPSAAARRKTATAFRLRILSKNRPRLVPAARLARVGAFVSQKGAGSHSVLYDDFPPRTTADQPAAFTPARWFRDYRLLNTARTLRKEQTRELHKRPVIVLPSRGWHACGAAARTRSCRARLRGSAWRCVYRHHWRPGAGRGPEPGRGRRHVGLRSRRRHRRAPSQGGGTVKAGHGQASRSGGGTSGTGGTAPPVVLSKGGVMLRLLTQAEYLTSVQSLLGTLTTPLAVPDDISVAGFASVGAGQMSVTDNGGDGVRNREPGSDCRGLRQYPALADAGGLRAEGGSQRRLRHHLHQDLRAGRLSTRPHRRGSAAVARGGQERGDAGGHRRVRAADGDVRTASIAELPLSGRDQRGRQQQRSPQVRRVVDGESPLVLADRRATQRGSAGCRNIGSARHRRRRPRRHCSLAHRVPVSPIA